MVSADEYVKNPEKVSTGDVNAIEMGPPRSVTTFVPEWAGNSISSRLRPAVEIRVLVN